MSHLPPESVDETPRSEPEIIPPGARLNSPFEQGIWMASDWQGVRRLYVAQLGPVGMTLLVLGIVFLAICVIFLVAGFVLIWIPIVAALVVVSIVAARLQRFFRR
jgi:hypothetical protein